MTPDNPATVSSLGTATATDNIDLSPTITNNATSNLFPRGATAIKWSATDDNHNVGTAIQYVTISPTNDATKPAVNTATPPDGAAISGPAAGVNILVTGTASDGQSGVKTVEVRTSTAAYQKAVQTNGNSRANWYYILNIKSPGSTTVVSRATDFFGNQQWDSTPISVSLGGPDTTAPTITSPPSMTVEATGELTPVSLGKPFVFDNSDPSPKVTNNSPRVSEATGFPLGTTTVIWTETDASGNSVSSNQVINVVDTTAPPTPQPLAPANGTITNNPAPLFDWSNVTDTVSAVTNDLQAAANPDFASPVVNQAGLTESPYTVPGTLGDGTYYWKVRSSDESNKKSPFSGVQTFTIDGVGPTVTASPPGGLYNAAQSVTLTSSKPSSTIYYTTDGSTPTTSSTVYSAPIAIIGQGTTTVLKFFAVDGVGNIGVVTTETYTIAASSFPITHMSDTTATSGLSIYSGQQAHVEFVSPTSQLAGKSIDQMTLKLRKTGTPTGIAEIGIFNPDLTVKKLFATKDATTLTSTYTKYTFSLSNSELYTLQSGDRIGIKYAGGDANNFVAVMLDRDSADPFEGANTYRQQYTTSWTSFTADDMYMVLKQTHG